MDFGWILTQKQVNKIFWIQFDSNLDKLMNFIFFLVQKLVQICPFPVQFWSQNLDFWEDVWNTLNQEKKIQKKSIFQYSCKSPKKVNFDSKNQQK